MAVVFVNGRYLPEKDANVSLLTEAFLYGWGVFETMRYWQGGIIYFLQHMQRLRYCARRFDLRIPYSDCQIREIIKRLILQNKIKDAYVRLTVYKQNKEKDGIFLFARPYILDTKKYQRGFRCQIVKLNSLYPCFLSGYKTNNYLFYQHIYNNAKKNKFDEAIIVNKNGEIIEGSRSNVFVVYNKMLFTPPLRSGALAGVTRQVVIDLARRHAIKLKQQPLSLRFLSYSQEAFLTNSLWGIMPIKEAGGFRAKAKREITDFINSCYQQLIPCSQL